MVRMLIRVVLRRRSSSWSRRVVELGFLARVGTVIRSRLVARTPASRFGLFGLVRRDFRVVLFSTRPASASRDTAVERRLLVLERGLFRHIHRKDKVKEKEWKEKKEENRIRQ